MQYNKIGTLLKLAGVAHNHFLDVLLTCIIILLYFICYYLIIVLVSNSNLRNGRPLNFLQTIAKNSVQKTHMVLWLKALQYCPVNS